VAGNLGRKKLDLRFTDGIESDTRIADKSIERTRVKGIEPYEVIELGRPPHTFGRVRRTERRFTI